MPAVTQHEGPPAQREVRVLRWSFQRGDEHLVCELGLDREESAYELITCVPWSTHAARERFADAQTALLRQASMEQVLLDEGWTLGRFETTTSNR